MLYIIQSLLDIRSLSRVLGSILNLCMIFDITASSGSVTKIKSMVRFYGEFKKSWPASSVRFIGRKQSSVHRLHAGRTGEGPHQPVIYTVQVVYVHAWQKPDGVPVNKVHHTDNTFSDLFFRTISSWIIDSFRQVLYKADPLCYSYLLFFRQLGC